MSGETLRDRLIAATGFNDKLSALQADRAIVVVAEWLRAIAAEVRTYPLPASLGATRIKVQMSNVAVEMHARGLELLADDLTPPAESTEESKP